MDFCFDRFSARTAGISLLDRLAGYKLLWCGMEPFLSTVNEHMEEYGRLAAAQAVRKMDVPMILNADYIVRESFPSRRRKPIPAKEITAEFSF